LKGLQEFIQDKVNITTEIFTPFINVEMPEKFQDKKILSLLLPSAWL
jgi:Tfp pilus assembly PilM family ATPase